MIICPRCQSQNYDNATFCVRCGLPFFLQGNAYQQPQYPMSSQPNSRQQDSPIQNQSVPRQKQPGMNGKNAGFFKSLKKREIILLVICILLFISTVVLALVLIDSENMKYKNAYQNLAATMVVSEMQDAVKSVLSGSDDPAENEPSADQNPVIVKPAASILEKQPTEIPPASEYQQIQLGEKISLDGFEFQFDRIEWTEVIKPSDTSSAYSYYSDTEGEIYLAVWGTAKNTSGETVNIDYGTKVEFVFNDKYRYSGSIEAEGRDKDDFFGSSMKPLQSSTMVMYASVPNEVKDNYQNCAITLGMNENMKSVSIYDDFDELERVFTLNVQ